MMVMLLASVAARGAPLNVAVFNFQMKEGPQQWQWLAKGLADQITTDFTRSRQLTVIARDEMQLVAAKVKWAPELAGRDQHAMDVIRKALKIDRLVTGVYSERGGQIEIIVQVLDVGGRRELMRKTFSGPAKDVLRLQKDISAALLGWFSGVPASEILPHLPVWCRSVEAGKLLYEGLHLFDQGQYPEAWLMFRQAFHNDPSYMEARYWVARMYYFMERYEHAQRAYEGFVYEAAGHPRLGDAIKEYLHACEKSAAVTPQAMLDRHAWFIERFGKVAVYNELLIDGAVPLSAWLKTRSAMILSKRGNFAAAVALASQACGELRGGNRFRSRADAMSFLIGTDSAYRHNLQTGKVLVPQGLEEHYNYRGTTCTIRFEPGQTETTLYYKPKRESRLECADGYYYDAYFWHFLLAPDGKVFTKITLRPLLEGSEGQMGACLHKHYFGDSGTVHTRKLTSAMRRGLVFENVPRSGIFHVHYWVLPADRQRDPHWTCSGVRVEAEFEDVGVHGSIDIQADTAEVFRVLVDGLAGRNGPGLIGLVPPGRHELTVLPNAMHQPLKIPVDVQAGKTTTVHVSLDWAPGSPWAQWKSGTLIGRDYPPVVATPIVTDDAPSIQADAHAIRVVWSYLGDLWMSQSSDGKNFSRPAMLPLPVSTGWMEMRPQCLRDETGRFVLIFLSDRQGQHQQRPYACWSRDGVHWSRPSMVVDRTVQVFHLMQDHRGMFIWTDCGPDEITIMESRDSYQWNVLCRLPIKGEPQAVSLVEHGPSYELYVSQLYNPSEAKNWETGQTEIICYRSKNLREWTGPVELAKHSKTGMASLTAVTTAQGPLVLFSRTTTTKERSFIQLFRHGDTGWAASAPQHGMAGWASGMGYHPRWGHLIAWKSENGIQFPAEHSGVYLMMGKSVEPLFGKKESGR
ncbi:MAG: hypothetical protein ABFD92_01795 [Planctomycetaceae bacterium]|nr:hypothetical protein [Planctomycetaceae bacterium]